MIVKAWYGYPAYHCDAEMTEMMSADLQTCELTKMESNDAAVPLQIQQQIAQLERESDDSTEGAEANLALHIMRKVQLRHTEQRRIELEQVL